LSLNGPRQCDIPNAGLNHLKVTQGRFEILAWASTSHLAGMPPQPIYRPPPDVLTPSSAPTGR
jgi:probable phosphoglycerate mutase